MLSESETESKTKKSGETRPGFIAYLLSDRYPIQKLEIPNLKFEIPKLSQKEVGKYPIASNPYLELGTLV